MGSRTFPSSRLQIGAEGAGSWAVVTTETRRSVSRHGGDHSLGYLADAVAIGYPLTGVLRSLKESCRPPLGASKF
jgi:hypothetical protein